MSSEFNFDMVAERYNAGLVSEHVLWPAIDAVSRRDWRERSTPGQQHQTVEHDDSTNIEARLHVETFEAGLIADPEQRPIKIVTGGLDILETITSPAQQERFNARAGEDTTLPDDLVLVYRSIRMFNFSNIALPTVSEHEYITTVNRDIVWESDDLYDQFDSDTLQVATFSEYEISQIEIGLTVLNLPAVIHASMQAIRADPIR